MAQQNRPVAMAGHVTRQFAKTAAFYGIYMYSQRMTGGAQFRQPDGSPIARQREAPTMRELLGDVADLVRKDAEAVRTGLLPPLQEVSVGPREMLARMRAMLQDVPEAVTRRSEGRADTVLEDLPDLAAQGAVRDADLPEYYQQDFHFQKGGWLSEESARIYDMQVETLFLGAAAAMRRQGMRPIAEFLSQHDQRDTHLVDVACGTGRFLSEIKQTFPALRTTGVDLSPAYLAEAERHLAGRRRVAFVPGNAEALPFETSSVDILTNVFLFHELPHDVRRTVAAEFARVLRPGGLLVYVDSLQWDDRPGWDGLLELFPQRFHEPYYEEYLGDPVEEIFSDTGLQVNATWPAFLSKVVVARAAGAN
ncbi:MAG: class I SAM-dependent methyltransferase [Pseudomonadota bacterium]